ncbi:hydantoinase/oxoprolinase family protein [Bacillus safensis]|uniref:hydantoinase/oxoprolinase family protein n=1 Tax=Bacillus TaxID=1386 RepID=UPI0007388F63|nr:MULTISPECIES: hydantoinase/oxoprolinase family protein [Bacillus]MBW4849168.1 hydantoinase/oxoprolinase family protein [Bacillaceae bacterium]KUF26708.1 hydantoin utilization protein A [Bacillus sp. G1(2015b)]MBW4853551.1 hydantoinase/oxoprolinase family protein [Bacillaceae bacterium]MBW4857066.1 hydantoinase/oxoprolinase family protein [Bacillaceae bacterium]MCK1974193.1 hydantoinase/oxoprolinase family protein [Bacillus safensis]
MADVSYRLGIDIGGTFTDLSLINEATGELTELKTPTVTDDPAQGIINGLNLLKKRGVDLSNIQYLVHGMTIGLNTLLQRKGADLALFVTEGFQDILSLQRLRLPVPYDFNSRLPEPLIPRKHVYPISERLIHDGTIKKPLHLQQLDDAVQHVISKKLAGIVISFLHSYQNPVHELQAKAYINHHYPQLEVLTSSELWPQMREYERTVMSVVNLYIQPKVKQYLQTLKSRLKEEGVPISPYITQSNGGLMDAESAATSPVKTLFSGPAAGVIGAARIAASASEPNLITFDVGGTSADISIIQNGQPTMAQSNQLSGFPIILPSVAMYSIGAGGGSVAWIDQGGLLKAGPESVGSNPGPASYGKGEKAALTDAFLICGYLNQERFAGGHLHLQLSAAKKAFQPIADQLNKTLEEAADQLIQVAVANMYTELSNVMEQQGFDPRDFSLLAFGGAGPVVANFLAREIHAKNVVVPPSPGTLCALGALTADFIHDAVLSKKICLQDYSINQLKQDYEKLSRKATDWVSQQNIQHINQTSILLLADARYQGQAFEIELPLSIDWLKQEQDIHQLIEAFHKLHQRQYGHRDDQAKIEFTHLRVRVIGETPPLPFSPVQESMGQSLKPNEYRRIFIEEKEYEASVYNRDTLSVGSIVNGPAVIEQDDTTTLILPNWTGSIDPSGNLVISKEAALHEN